MIWGFDYNLTNYNFRKTFKQTTHTLPEGEIQGFILGDSIFYFETVVGEIIVESPYRWSLFYLPLGDHGKSARRGEPGAKRAGVIACLG